MLLPLPTYEVALSDLPMARDRDDESGKYTDAYSDEDFIEAIRTEGGLAGTTAVAEIVGCTRRQALNRLKELRERNRVQSKDVGRSLVWQLNSDE
jgi:hypothetical protein